MSMPQTIREAHKVDILPSLQYRSDRVCSIVFDGIPLGDYPIEPAGNRFGEKEMLAMVLVSCEVDRCIESIQSLSERPGENTPDFQAKLQDQSLIRIEVTRFADSVVSAYMSNMNAMFNIVQATRRRVPSLEKHITGLHITFDFQVAPRPNLRNAVAEDIVRLLFHIDRSRIRLCY